MEGGILRIQNTLLHRPLRKPNINKLVKIYFYHNYSLRTIRASEKAIIFIIYINNNIVEQFSIFFSITLLDI